MATGGTITWVLDVDDKKFTAGMVKASAEAKAFDSTVKGFDFKGAASQAQQAFGQVADSLRNILLIGTAVGAGVAFGLTKAATAAFDQVRQVENATFALKAYEKNGEAVNGVLKDLVAFARSDTGTLFNRQDLFAAASTLKAYGEQTGNLTERVKILARGVSLGQTTFQELSQVIGRAAASGSLAADQYDVLANRGIILDKSFRGAKVTSDQLYDALSQALPAELLQGRANTIDGVMIQLQSSFRDLGGAILGVDKDSSTFIKGGLGDTIIQTLKSLRDTLKDPALTGALQQLGRDIGSFIKDVLPKLIEGFKWFVEHREDVVKAFLAIAAAWVAVKAVFIGASIAAAATNPILLIAWAVALLVGALAWLQLKFDIFGKAWQALQPIIQPVIDIFKALFDFIGKQLAPVFDFLAQHLDALKVIGIALLAAFLTPIVIAIILVVGAALALVAAFALVVFIIRQVINFFIGLWQAANDAVAKIVDVVGKKIGETIDFFKSLPGKILAAVGNLGSTLYNAGRDLIQGLLNGVGSLISSIGRFMADRLPSAIRDPFKKALGISSPSKVFAGYGENIMEGLAIGITAGSDNAVNAVTTAAGDLAGSFTSFGPNGGLGASVSVSGDSLAAASGPAVVNVKIDNSGIVARSRSEWRDISKDMIASVNEELRSKRLPEIGGGNIAGASTV